MECEFCKKQLNSISSLNYHKKTNKKCLDIQNKKLQDDIFSQCDFCSKTFTIQTLKKHIKSCKNKKIKEDQEKDIIIELLKRENNDKTYLNEELKKEILSLNNTILKLQTENDIYIKDHELIQTIAKQPKNNNKIRIMNNFFDNPEKIKQLVDEKLTQTHIIDGQKGVAQFAYDALLKDDDGNVNYFCTDPSRNIFKFQNNDGNIEKDIKANKLTNLLLDAGIKNKTSIIAPELWTKKDGSIDTNKFQIFNPYANEIILMQSDNSIFRNELASLTSL
jgi:hypothetical protein